MSKIVCGHSVLIGKLQKDVRSSISDESDFDNGSHQ
jgi:hypothetical protein